MKHETLGEAGLSYAPCRYGTSRILFRGPRRPLDGRYIAFVGGTETYGRFITTPFPALVEESLGDVCVNFGMINASVDAYANEPTILAACHDASLNIVQVMGAQNMSNRFYTVHPRRNDRFLRASTVLHAIYPDVDFSDFCFTRHMLSTLYAQSPDRFEIVRMELETAWLGRMTSFLRDIGRHTFLLWFAGHLPSDGRWDSRSNPFSADPLFVTRRMIDALRPLVRGVVMVQPSVRALGVGTDGMVFSPLQAVAAAECLGVAAHQETAEALITAIRATNS
jgi:Domain of unknown function (DUF6473)